MKVSDVKTVFDPNIDLVGHRDIQLAGVSALKG